MRDEAWVQGMRDLVVSFPSADQDSGVLRVRGEVYLRELGSLSDEAWLYAVRESIRNERWFPTVAQLLDYAGRAPVMAPTAALSDDTRTPEEKRADAARLLETVKAAFEERAATLPPRPLVSTPPPPLVISKDDYPERLDELDRQKEQILAAPAATEGRG